MAAQCEYCAGTGALQADRRCPYALRDDTGRNRFEFCPTALVQMHAVRVCELILCAHRPHRAENDIMRAAAWPILSALKPADALN